METRNLETAKLLQKTKETLTITALTAAVLRGAVKNEIERIRGHVNVRHVAHITAQTTDDEILDNTGRDRRGLLKADPAMIYRDLLFALQELS